MWFYFYQVEVFDEEERAMVVKCGTVAATSLTEVAEKVCNYYGEEQINELKIRIIENSEGGLLEDN